jgi:hypothetical protein
MKMNKKYASVSMMALAAVAATSLLANHVSAADLGVNVNTEVSATAKGESGMHLGVNMVKRNANRVAGKVTAINGTTLTVADQASGTSYAIVTTSAKLDKSGATITVSDIVVGDTIIAEGTATGTTLTANVVHDGAVMKWGPGPVQINRGVMGTVTAVSGTTITVSAKTGTTTTVYTVTAANATVKKNDAASTVSAIAVGDQVRVQGTVSGTTVTATNIVDGKMTPPPIVLPQGNGQPIIGGTVTAISGNTITIANKSNVSYTIDATSATFIKSGVAATLSSVAVGDTVVAQGTINGTSVTAVSITDQGKVQASTATAGDSKGFFGAIGGFFAHLFGF